MLLYRLGCILCAALADIHGIGAKVRPPLQPKPQMSRVRRASMRAASLTVHNGLDVAALDTTATATVSSTSIVIGSSAVFTDMKHKLVVCSSDSNSEGHSEVSTRLLLALHTTHSSSDDSGSKDRIDLDALLSEVDFDLNFDEDHWTAKRSSSSGGGSSSVAVAKTSHCNTANTGTTVLIPTVRRIPNTANVCSSAVPTQILHSNSKEIGNTSTKHMYSSTTTANTTTTTSTNTISNTKKADLSEKTSTIKYNAHKELVRVSFTRNTELTGVHSGLPGKQLGGVRGVVSFTVPVSRTVNSSSSSSSTTAPVAPQKSTTQDNIQYEPMQCTPPLTTLTDTLSEKDEWVQEVGDTYTHIPMTVQNHHTEQSHHSKAQLFAMGASSMLTVEDSAADVCSSSSAEAAVEYVPTAAATTTTATDVVNCKGEDSLLTTVSSTAATVSSTAADTTTVPTTNTATSAHIHNLSTETKEEYIEQCDSSEPAEFNIPLSMSVTGIDPLHNPLSPVFTLYRGITPLYSERVAGLLKTEQSEEDSTLRLHSRLGTASAVQSRALTPALNTHSSNTECAHALTLSNCSSDRQERATAINLPYVRYSTLETELSQLSVEGGVYEPSPAAVAAAEHGGSSQHFSISTEASLHSQHSLAHSSEYYTTLSARERTSPSLELPLKGTSSRMRPVFDDSVYGESVSSTMQDLQAQFLQEMGLDYNQLYGTGGILSPTVAHSTGKHHHYKNRSPKPTAVLGSTQQLGVSSKAFPLRRVLYEKDVVVFPSSSEGSSGLPELVSEGPRGIGSIRPAESDKVYVQHKLEQFYVHAEDTLRQQQLMSEADAAITARRVFDQAHILAAATADQHDLRRQRQQNTICRKWLSSQRSGTKRTKKHKRLPVHTDITTRSSIVDDGSSRLNTAMYRAVRADLKSHGSAESSILRNYTDLIVSGGSRDRMETTDKKMLEQCSEGNSWQWLTGSEQGMLDDASILGSGGSGGGGLSCVGAAVPMPLATATATAPTALKGSTESPRKRIVPTIQVLLPLPTAEVHSEDRAITPALQKLIQQAAAATVVDACGGSSTTTTTSCYSNSSRCLWW